MVRVRVLAAASLAVALLPHTALLAATKPKANPRAESARAASASAAVPEMTALAHEIKELKEVLAEQAAQLASQRKALEEQREKIQQLQNSLAAGPAGGGAGASIPSAAASQEQPPDLNRISNELDAIAQSQADPPRRAAKVNRVNQEFTEAQKKTEGRLAGLGNFRLSGDVRVRYEPFIQDGTQDRHRERVRARLNFLGNLTDEIYGGISVASGDASDNISTNQTFTGFFTRKNFAFDRYFLSYTPKRLRNHVQLIAGKMAYPWFRTEMTFDNDLNPEGFAEKFNYDLKHGIFKNINFVAFELPFNEVAAGSDSFIYGGQVGTKWQWGKRHTVALYGTGINFRRINPLAGALGGSLAILNIGGIPTVVPGNGTPTVTGPISAGSFTNPCTFAPVSNQLTRSGCAVGLSASSKITGFYSRFAYVGGTLVWDAATWSDKWPVRLLVDFVQNQRANQVVLNPDGTINPNLKPGKRAYWYEFRFGRVSQPRDVQVAYTFMRIEQEAVLGAFNFSDLRSQTNVKQHRLELSYRLYKNVTLNWTGFIGRLLQPQLNPSFAKGPGAAACTTAPFTGCSDSYLTRMQFDAVYSF